MHNALKTAWRRAQKNYTAAFDPEFIRTANLILRQICRLGLNSPRIAEALGCPVPMIESMVIIIETCSSHLINAALRPRRKWIRKTGRRFRPDSDGIYPLEYYLLACSPASPASPAPQERFVD